MMMMMMIIMMMMRKIKKQKRRGKKKWNIDTIEGNKLQRSFFFLICKREREGGNSENKV